MSMKLCNLRVLLIAIPALTMAINARAGFISGYGWVTAEGNVNGSGTGATPGTLASSTCHGATACTTGNADVTFTTNGIGFSTSGNTFGTWLASSAFTLDSLAYHNGQGTSTALDPSIWEFTGTASFTNGQTFTFAHDDGVTMLVNGVTYVNQPGPTGAVTTTATYTGPTGNEAFEIVYTECCSPPAVLQTTLVGPANGTPEPSSVIMVGSALLLGLGRMVKRKLVR
jgi:hypothetical protein